MNSIPREIAIRICETIQDDHEKKIYAVGEMQCAACIKSSNRNPEKMCYSSLKDNRGCIYVNKRFDKGKYSH